MMHPGLYLVCGLLCEMLVQFTKRAAYWFTVDPSIHYAALLVGDLVFLTIFISMALSLRWTSRHTGVLALFFMLCLLAMVLNGPSAAVVAVRNIYLWILMTVLFVLDAPRPNPYGDRTIGMAAEFVGLLLLAYGLIQVGSDYTFEMPWFELSGTSLNYDGVTNFGEAAKAFSLLSGPTDFSVFGLFVFALGFSTRNWRQMALGAGIVLLSGTRGVLMSVPLWMMMAWFFPRRVKLLYFSTLGGLAVLIGAFADTLIAFFYSLPNSRFSMATLGPRIELWMSLDWRNLIAGGGLAVNLAQNLADAPVVIDSGLLYLITELGLPLAVGLITLLLHTSQKRLQVKQDALALLVGALVIASIAQIPLHTRLSNFLICLIIYSGNYCARRIQVQAPGRLLAT